MSDLVVIEAPGKLATVHRCLEQQGRAVSVVATLGHLYRYPPDPDRVGIAWVGDELVEERVPERPETLAFLRKALAACSGRVIVATDDDAEGHVIAQDVARLAQAVGVAGPVLRALPHAMTPEAWAEAVDTARPLDPEDARPGTARRMLDRLIAQASRRASGGGRPVGRVQAALLGLGAAARIPDRMVSVGAPAADGGAPFLGVGPLHGDLPAEPLPVLPVDTTATESLAEAMHGGDALLALSSQLGMPIGEASALLQSMYEVGEISYPRSSGRGLRADGAAAVAMLARSHAIRAFTAARLPSLPPTAGPAHEAVHLVLAGMIERLDLGRPLRLCATVREAAATVIGRRCIEAGIGITRDRPVRGALPAWARDLDWHRDGRRPALPWRPGSPARERRLDLATGVVHVQIATGLGRPSTWARHAERCAASDWFSPDHTLALPGRVSLQSVTTALRDPDTSVAIDRVLGDARLRVRERVVEALTLALDNDPAAARHVIEELAHETLEVPAAELDAPTLAH